MEKKNVLAIMFALLLVLPMGLSQTQLQAKPISRLHMVGNGLAINSGDPMDFSHIKVAIGAVRIKPMPLPRPTICTKDAMQCSDGSWVGRTGPNCEFVCPGDETGPEETVGNAPAFTVKRIGVLKMDNDTYHLRNIAVSIDEISGDIYSTLYEKTVDGNSAKLGSFYAARFEKPGKDVWAGEIEISGMVYNAYVLGADRGFKPLEAAEKVGEYCEDNPGDERCTTVASNCRDNPRACKTKITQYCEENEDDEKCGSVKEDYCIGNAGDVRCRKYLKDKCKEAKEEGSEDVKEYCETVPGVEMDKIEETTASVEIRPRNGTVSVKVRAGKVRSYTIERGEDEEELSRPIRTIDGRVKMPKPGISPDKYEIDMPNGSVSPDNYEIMPYGGDPNGPDDDWEYGPDDSDGGEYDPKDYDDEEYGSDSGGQSDGYNGSDTESADAYELECTKYENANGCTVISCDDGSETESCLGDIEEEE